MDSFPYQTGVRPYVVAAKCRITNAYKSAPPSFPESILS